MNCNELKELISAYLDNELGQTQRDFVEQHLLTCSDCQATLANYKRVKQTLLSLRVMPAIPDIKSTTLAKIKSINLMEKPRRLLRTSLVVMPIVVVVVISLSLIFRGSPLTPQQVLAKAQIATTNIQSYSLNSASYIISPGVSTAVAMFVSKYEYNGENDYHGSRATAENYYPKQLKEYIVYNNNIYYHEIPDTFVPVSIIEQSIANVASGNFESPIPDKSQTLAILGSLINLKQLSDETIDGVTCLHYQGDIDTNKMILDNFDKWKATFSEDIASSLEKFYLSKKITDEIWIGKGDYLVRRLDHTIQPNPNQNVGGSTFKSVTKYNYFDKPIDIKLPLSDTGDLIPGWYLYTKPQ